MSLCQPTSVAILETKCDHEKVWKYHHHLYQIDPNKHSSYTNDFLGMTGSVCDLCVCTHTHTHTHTHTLYSFTPDYRTFDPYPKHSEDPYRNPKVYKETSPGKMKGGVF